MSQRILVTGASGFTGSHLCKKLAEQGNQVLAMVRRSSNLNALEGLDVEPVYCDLASEEVPVDLMRGIDVVYHIAAVFRQEGLPERYFYDVNVHGTERLLNSAERAGVGRFVHCSTVGVHGDVKNPPANEDAPYGPGDHYQESKTEGEKLVLRHMVEGRIPIVVFRPGGIYGPGDLRFLKLFKGIKKRRFVMLGSGEVKYQLVYIDDLVDGIVACGTRENAVGNIYILTGENAITLKQFVQLISQELHVPYPRLRFPIFPVYFAGFLCEIACRPFGIQPPLYRRRVDFFQKTRWFDISKAKRELGFHPQVDERTGICRTARWYEQVGLL